MSNIWGTKSSCLLKMLYIWLDCENLLVLSQPLRSEQRAVSVSRQRVVFPQFKSAAEGEKQSDRQWWVWAAIVTSLRKEEWQLRCRATFRKTGAEALRDCHQTKPLFYCSLMSSVWPTVLWLNTHHVLVSICVFSLQLVNRKSSK